MEWFNLQCKEKKKHQNSNDINLNDSAVPEPIWGFLFILLLVDFIRYIY